MKRESINPTAPKKVSHNQRVGRWGERVAREYLVSKGYEIIDQNVHSVFGELDIVARLENQMVFVEVKTRTNTNSGYPESGMTPKKVQHLLEAAQDYLEKHPESPSDWKIEVVAIIGTAGQYQIELFDSLDYGY